jgi:DHA1 family bicyclomycin/chloramphenicol resistance-like MFS transporter
VAGVRVGRLAPQYRGIEGARVRIRHESAGFTVLLGACAAMPPLGVDMGQPATTPIAHALGTSPAAVAYALSLFMVGFATAPVVFGPLSDRFGRRPVLLTGCALFGVAGWGCALAQSITSFMVWRLIEGAGAGVGTVLAMAIIRDLFDGYMARARLSYLAVLGSLAPMIAPTLGVLILGLSGWRSIYGLLGTIGVALVVAVGVGLDEPAAREKLPSLAPRQLLATYARALGNPTFRGYAMISVLSFACLFAYITGSPLLMINTLGASPRVYGFLFALTSFGFMLGGVANGRLSMRGVPASRLLVAGQIIVTLSILFLLTLSVTGGATLPRVTALLFVITLSNSLIAPNATVSALHPVPEIAGTASSIIVCAQWLLGAGSGALAGLLFDGRTPRGLAEVMGAFALASVAVYWGLVRPHERRARGAELLAERAAAGTIEGS